MRCSDKFKPVVDIHGVYFAAQFPENRKPPRFIRGGQRERRWYRPEPKLRTPDIPRPAHSSICSKLGFRFQANIRPGATGHIKQKPSLELMQLIKQGFRFSLGSSWQLRLTQEETSRKSESQLKQRRSSTNKTNHPLNLSTIPTAHLLSLGSG